MNIEIYHDGNNITEYVVSYIREQKICTGVGTLDVILPYNIPVTFTTWDSVQLYEGGKYVGKYFIATITKNEPGAIIAITCQDTSKKIVDYLIIDQYTVDYPSTSRFWMEKFLDEAGISYEFDTAETGSLLSNMSSLGLMTLYEQMQLLLQMSGWYMYFSADEILKIGSLTTNKSNPTTHVTESSIRSILRNIDDKMLRNRAVVLGGYSSQESYQISVDISVHTPWNYDSVDKRAVVVSNSNIPTVAAATELANTALGEFAKITDIKTIELGGVYNIDLGDIVSVNSKIFTGSGIVTTIGAEMSRDGFITKVTLDERCPRLFGFYRFDGYVYIGTYGNGVWRKKITTTHLWEDASTGLEDLNVVDLHINNGNQVCVTSDGSTYRRSFGSATWNKIEIVELPTPISDDLVVPVESGIVSSGIMSRACILNRETGDISIVCDTYSGINLPTYSGTIADTGFADYSGMKRAWLVRDRISYGQQSSVPLNISGIYSIRAYDVETDGKNVYASVGGGSGISSDFSSYDFGSTDSSIYLSDNSIESSFDQPEAFLNNEDSYNREQNSFVRTPLVGIYDDYPVIVTESLGGDYTIKGPVALTSQGSYVTVDTFFIDPGDPDADIGPWVFSKRGTELGVLTAGFIVVASKRISASSFYIYGYDYDSVAETISIERSILDITDTASMVVSDNQVIYIYDCSIPLSGVTAFDPITPIVKVLDSKIGMLAAYRGIKISGESTNKENCAMLFSVYDIDTDTSEDHFNHEEVTPTGSGVYGRGGGQTFDIGQLGDSLQACYVVEEYNQPVSSNPEMYSQWVVMLAGVIDEDRYITELYYSDKPGGWNPNTANNRSVVQFDNDTLTITHWENLYLLYDGPGFAGSTSNYEIYISHKLVAGGDYEDSYVWITLTANPSFIGSDPGDAFGPFSGSNINTLQGNNPDGIDLGTYTVFNGQVDKDPNKVLSIDPNTMEVLTDESSSNNGYTLHYCLTADDLGDGKYYFACDDGIDYGVGKLDWATRDIEEFIPVDQSTNKFEAYMRGNFIYYYYYYEGNYLSYVMYYPSSLDMSSNYAILQIDEEDSVTVLSRTVAPARLDVSNLSPLYTVQNLANTQMSFYITSSGTTQNTGTTIPSGTAWVHDIRYANYGGSGIVLGDTYSGMGFITLNDGIYQTNLSTLMIGSGILILSSGMANMIETTNNFYPDQYMFASISGIGISGSFVQKDVNSGAFLTRTDSIPSGYITIIRVDDIN